MSKKPHGHYCRICQQYKANEKFSGRGHAAHICKACAKRGNKPPEVEPEPPVFIDRDNLDEYDCLKLLATDGMLVKRPLLIDGLRVLIGFKRDEWEAFLG